MESCASETCLARADDGRRHDAPGEGRRDATIDREQRHEPARPVRPHRRSVARRRPRRRPVGGGLRPDRRRLRGEGQHAGVRRGALPGGRRDLHGEALLSRSAPRGVGAPVFRRLLPPRRAHPAPQVPAGQSAGSGPLSLHGAGGEELRDLQRGAAPVRHPGRPHRAPGRAERLAHHLDDRRPGRRGRLVARPDRPDRAPSAAHPPVRAGPARAVRSRHARRVADRAPRQQ